MKKSIFAFFFAFLMITAAVTAGAVANNGNFVLENAGMFSEEEVDGINARALEIYRETGNNVCILFTENAEENKLYYYLEQKYNEAAGSESGILIGVNLNANKWTSYLSGDADLNLTENDIDGLWDAIDKADTWYEGAMAYLDSARELLTDKVAVKQAEEGEAYTLDTVRLIDNADLLTETEEAALEKKLDEISERQGCDIVVVTENTLGGKSPMEYADDYYDYNGYADSGALLLISMEDRDWYISTKGECIAAITDAGLEYMSQRFLGPLSEGSYASAFGIFADSCDEFITKERSGEAYDINNIPKIPKSMMPDSKWILYSLAIGAALASFITSNMKSKLKTVGFNNASEYVRHGSLKLTRSDEIFLYSNVSRTPRADNTRSSGGSSTHTSSSGSSHGGGGGKF